MLDSIALLFFSSLCSYFPAKCALLNNFNLEIEVTCWRIVELNRFGVFALRATWPVLKPAGERVTHFKR